MKQRFSAHNGWRNAVGGANVIGETEVGEHANTLFYQGISTCTSITFRCANKLVGIHLTVLEDVSMFGRLLEGVKERAGPILAIYHIGRIHNSAGGWNSQDDLAWPAQAARVRYLMGCDETVQSFYAQTQAGTRDVRIVRNGAAIAARSRPLQIGNLDDNASWTTALPLLEAPGV